MNKYSEWSTSELEYELEDVEYEIEMCEFWLLCGSDTMPRTDVPVLEQLNKSRTDKALIEAELERRKDANTSGQSEEM